MIPLTQEIAFQFAVMLTSGMPAEDAIRYFIPEDDPDPLGTAKTTLSKWLRSTHVKQALKTLQGRSWQDMSGEERIKSALDLHYNQLAYFLYSHNYASLVGADKAKADTCRQALEAKLAGMAGKGDFLSRFFDDVQSGRVKLVPPASPIKVLPS